MSSRSQKDVRTLADLQAQPLEVVKRARQTRRPVVIKNKGKEDVVVMDAAAFRRHVKLANLSRLLAEGEADIRAGRTRPVRQFFDELRREKKISR